MKPHIKEKDYEDLIDASWDALIETGFSFVITDKSNRVVGVSLSFEANSEPECECTGPHAIIFEFLETVESPIRSDTVNQVILLPVLVFTKSLLILYFFFKQKSAAKRQTNHAFIYDGNTP